MNDMIWRGDKGGDYYLLSDPEPNWLFDVTFQSDSPMVVEEKLTHCIPISFALPQYETTYVERYYLGTCKSAPINRKYSGDAQMTFIIRCEKQDNDYIAVLGGLQQDIKNDFKHLELDRTFNKILVKIYPRKDDVGITNYTYYNVILTELNYSEISYEGDEAIKVNMTYHYDFWTVDEQE